MRIFALALLCLPLVLGCGSNSPSPAPDFTLSVVPNTISLMNGGPAVAIAVAASAVNGSTAPVSVKFADLPTGVTASPSTISITPGQLGQIMLAASGAAVSSTTPITLTGTSGTLTHSAMATLAVKSALTNAALSATSFDFGGNLVGFSLVKQVVSVTNTGGSDLSLSPTLTGDASYALVPGKSCGSTLSPGSNCVETVSYTPTVGSGQNPQTSTLNLGLGDVAPGTSQTVVLSGVAAVMPAGTVTATNNPQVALYSMTLPFPGSITVNFGPDTSYGRATWSQPAAAASGQINVLVAGMLPTTQYHMQASVQFSNGINVTDVDHTFTTKVPLVKPNLTATTTAGMTPQPGVEQFTFLTGATPGLAVTDLEGNVLWSYALPSDGGRNSIEGAKLMANGDFLLTVGQRSNQALIGSTDGPGLIDSIREIDLAGNIVREISANDLSAELQDAGYNLTLQEFHHDVLPLANGHWIVLANVLKPFTDLPGYPGTTNVLGDVVIDLDQNLEPVWVWNEFDHLDVNRHPMGFPDWTHTNAIIYSPSDGNIFVSVRHQNWVLKVDYHDGTGKGDILWRLGEGGDFSLAGGVDPVDWQYAQHAPSLFSANSSGNFSLGLMDNGDDRIFPAGVTCGTTGAPACLYTTIPVFQIDEGTKTATLTFHQILPPSLYSLWGGNTELLANGNIEYELSDNNKTDSDVFEVTPTATPQTVWHLHSTAANAYRGYRIPSLYPGVQW